MEEKVFLTKDAILSVNDLQIEEVFVPQWKGTVRVRSLSGAERDDLEASMIDDKGNPIKKNFRARLLSLALCDERGKPLFSQAEAEALGKKNGAAMSAIFTVAMRLSGMGAPEVEAIKKN
jgi:hypothetical protein